MKGRFKNAVERIHNAIESEKRENLSDTESDGEDGPHFLEEMFGSDEIKMWLELFTKYPSLQNISGLHIKLEHADESWMKKFLEIGGLESVINMIDSLISVRYSRNVGDLGDAVLYLACINCLRSIMHKNNGLSYFCEECNPAITRKIILGMFIFSIS